MSHISQDAPASIELPTELVIVLNPSDLGFSEFIGTRAMLESEVSIPNAAYWPQGYDDRRWQEGQFSYCLSRQRPPGAKGPRRDFSAVDWFCLRIELTQKPSYAEREIARKEKELKDAIYLQSAEGQERFRRNFFRYLEAMNDDKFQAFKSCIPGLVRAKHPRSTKAANTHTKGEHA